MTRALVVIGAVLGSSLLLRPAAAEVDSGTLQRSFWGGSVNSGCRTVTIGRAGPLSNNVAAFLDWWGGSLDVATTRIPNCSTREFNFHMNNLATTCYNGETENELVVAAGPDEMDLSHDCSTRWGASGLMWFIQLTGGS